MNNYQRIESEYYTACDRRDAALQAGDRAAFEAAIAEASMALEAYIAAFERKRQAEQDIQDIWGG